MILRDFPHRQAGRRNLALMSEGDRTAVSQVYVNVAKSIAAFERTLRAARMRSIDTSTQHGRTLCDRKIGARLILRFRLRPMPLRPRLTDDAFHNLRFPTGRFDGAADIGRIAGIALFASNEFRADGRFSDVNRSIAPSIAGNWTLGAFKTPLCAAFHLRSVRHGGTFPRLKTFSRAFRRVSPAERQSRDRREGHLRAAIPEDRIPELAAFLRVLGDAP